MNLVEQFYEVRGGTLTAALDSMNQALGTRYDLTRLGQWRRGHVPVPHRVQAYMRRLVLSWLWRHHGNRRITSDLLERVLEACEPPSAASRAVARSRSLCVPSPPALLRGIREF